MDSRFHYLHGFSSVFGFEGLKRRQLDKTSGVNKMFFLSLRARFSSKTTDGDCRVFNH